MLQLNKSKELNSNFKFRRRFTRLCLRWLTIAGLIWLLVFNAYIFHYKLENYLKNRDHSSQPEDIPLFQENPIDIDLLSPPPPVEQPWLLPPQKQVLRSADGILYLDETALTFQQNIIRKPFKVNCEEIIESNPGELKKALKLLNVSMKLAANSGKKKKYAEELDPSSFIFDKKICEIYKETRGFANITVRSTELTFPLAYTIHASKNIEQFERLFRLIYRPHNIHCIHIDKLSDTKFVSGVHSIANCFKNIIFADKRESILDQGSLNQTRSELTCMHQLLDMKKKIKWEYLISLNSEQDFPLRTNYELTRILRIYNGANDVQIAGKYPKDRFLFSWRFNQKNNSYAKTAVKKKPIPLGYEIVKGGSPYTILSYKFVNYTMFDKNVKQLLSWSKDAYKPNEWFWATLQYNTKFKPPGGLKTPTPMPLFSKARHTFKTDKHDCQLEPNADECTIRTTQLSSLVLHTEFFANSVSLEQDPLAYQCLEEWYSLKVKSSQIGNLRGYCRLPYVMPYANQTLCGNKSSKKAKNIKKPRA